MRWLTIIFIAPMVTLGCRNVTHNPNGFDPIDASSVSSIEILERTVPPDTIRTHWKRLTPAQVEFFVDRFNGAPKKGLIKCLPKYKIVVFFKNDSSRSFRACGQYLKEYNDWAIDFNDEVFFEKLYDEAVLKENQ